ncbi:MAG TPA: hypothetical protein VFS40_08055 [Gemmatimonadales bacterium]|nr:hypothetical protein [Gemmatimonadales bacterium]
MPTVRRIHAAVAGGALALAVLGACHPPEAPSDLGLTLTSPRVAWSEGEVRVHGADLRGALAQSARAPRLWVHDTLPLLTYRLDDTTLGGRLPALRAGTVPLALELDGVRHQFAPMQVAGFTDAFTLPGEVTWDLLPYHVGGHPAVIAVGGGPNAERRAGVYQLDTRTVTAFGPPVPWDVVRGPGVSYRPGVFLLKPVASDTVEAWTPWPTPRRVSTHPGVSFFRQLMELGPDTWFASSHHQFTVSSPAGPSFERAEETEGVHMSPRGDRATIRVDYDEAGAPVFDVPSGRLAYHVAGVRTVLGADFSPDGELLALGGTPIAFDGPGRVTLVRAATGEVLRDTVFASQRLLFGLAFDPEQPLLYAGVTEVVGDSARPAVLVLRRDDLRPVAKLGVPADAPACPVTCYKGVLIRSLGPALYVVAANGPLRVWRFALPADLAAVAAP